MFHFMLSFLLIAWITVIQAVYFDLSNGESEGLIKSCPAGASGPWVFEQASLYSGGPSEGTVLTSSKTGGSCLTTTDLFEVTPLSKFFIRVYVPYSTSSDKMQVWLVNGKGLFYEWFSVVGPLASGDEWMDLEWIAPSDISTDVYKIEIQDQSGKHGISIRNFEITDQPRSTTIGVTVPTVPDTTTTQLEETTVTTIEVTDTTTELDTSTAATTAVDGTTADQDGTTTQATTEVDSTTTQATTNLDGTTTQATTDLDGTTTQATTYLDSTTTTSSSAETTSEGEDEEATAPPADAGGFTVDGWSVALGVVLGAVLLSALLCSATCCWWLLCVKWRRQHEPRPELAALPRLEVVSSGSRFSIAGQPQIHTNKNSEWRNSNRFFQ